MRRLVFILLMALLPLQSFWSAAATYCQHETSSAAVRHFGHHEHAHKEGGKASGSKLNVDTDCGVCHSGALPVVMEPPFMTVSTAVMLVLVDKGASSLRPGYARAPDRPQWLRLT